MKERSLLVDLRRRIEAAQRQHIPLGEALWIVAAALERDAKLADPAYHQSIDRNWQKQLRVFMADAAGIRSTLVAEGLEDPIAGVSSDPRTWHSFLVEAKDLPRSNKPLFETACALNALIGARERAQAAVYGAAERGEIAVWARKQPSAQLEAIPAGYFTLPRAFDPVANRISIALRDMQSVFDERLDSDNPPWHGPMVLNVDLERHVKNTIDPKKGSSGVKRGRKRYSFWEPCHTALFKFLEQNGEPTEQSDDGWHRQADVERWVADWLAKHDHEASEERIRTYVSRWLDEYTELKAGKADN